MEMVVANKKRYVLSSSGKVNKNHFDVVRTGMVVTKDYVEMHNANTEVNGVFFEVDEEKTEDFYTYLENKRKAGQEAKELEKALALSQLQNIAGIAQKAVVESLTAPKVKSDVQNQADELGIEYRANISDTKLQERINEHLNN